MKNRQKNTGQNNEGTSENLQDRVKSLFAGQNPPSYVSIRDVDAMKARIHELEAELASRPSNRVRQTNSHKAEPVRRFEIESGVSNEPASKDVKTDVDGRSQRAARMLTILLITIVLSLPLYLYWAVQTGAWQLVAIVAALIFSGGLVAFATSLARRNRVETAMLLMVANSCLVIPLIAGLITGVGIVLTLTQFVIILAIVGQSLTGTRATAALVVGFIFSIITFLIDFLAGWSRLSVPGLQSTVPVIAVAFIGVLGFVTLRQFQNFSLRSKLVVAFVVIALVSIGSVGYVTNRVATEQFNEELGTNFNVIASHIGRETSDSILANKLALDGLVLNKFIQDSVEEASLNGTTNVAVMKRLDQRWAAASETDPLIREVLENEVAGELRELQARLPQYAELFVTDTHGAIIASTDLTSDYYQADEEWWQSAWNDGAGDTFISQPEFDESTGIYAIDMALPIPGHNRDDIVGILRATVNINELTSLLAEGRFGETGRAVLVLPNNQYITMETGVELDTLDPWSILGVRSMKGAYSEFTYDSIPSLVSKAPVLASGTSPDNALIEALNWTIVIHQDVEEADQPIVTTTRGITLTAVGVLIIVGLLALFVGAQFAKPIESLTSVAEQFAAGNLLAQANDKTKDEIGTLAGTFNRMTVQLRETLVGLEHRVAERTHDLELASEVARAITEKVGNLSEMLSTAAETIRTQFDLYYTQVYLVDDAGRSLVLRAGTGESGARLLQRSHRLPLSANSLNARAATSQRPVLVLDTQKSANFLPNPLLPLTRSELAVPLVVNNIVVGVLDMQSERPEAFSEANLPAFEVLAGQLAIAIQNSTLFDKAEQARSEMEEQARRLTSSGWQEFLNAFERSENIGYVFDQNEVLPLVDTQGTTFDNTLAVPIQVTGVNVGEIRLGDENRNWTKSETEIVQATVTHMAQHIENLRLLAEAEYYRSEAEQVSRRLTSEGWKEYLRSRTELADGYTYDQNHVKPLNGNWYAETSSALSYPLVVRDESIGDLILNADRGPEAQSADIVAAVAKQLSDHIENLRLLESAEQKRLELETVATVSSTASTVLDPDMLLQSVVDLTKERFGLYHAHIYLADDSLSTLLLAAGAGEVGRILVGKEHFISMDAERSLVARAARERQPVIVNDVRSEHDFLPNPLLPDTHAEMAVPMIVGDKVLGVFDVQSDKTSGFTDEDASIYSTLAAQVGVALQNARLYVEQAATVTQLRELDRLKSSFLANMSHELRTPLNSILGFTDVMLEGLDGNLTEFMDNDLRLIQKNGQHLLHLINDVLDMAKIESGRMNLHPETFKVHSVLDEVASITSTLASEKNLSLFIDEGSDAELEIYADNTRLRQVMINLVNNSIKFTEKGKISISAKPMDGARVLISVKDTGIGIPPDKLDAVFQEFTQVDTSTTRKAGGTGLGLPISRRLVEMHGGRLWAESTGVDGEGCTFFVELPVEARITDVIEKQER